MCCNPAIPLCCLPPLQSRVRALTEMQAPLEELRELVEEAEGLPVAMPEVERIQVGSRGCWAGRADVTRASQGVCMAARGSSGSEQGSARVGQAKAGGPCWSHPGWPVGMPYAVGTPKRVLHAAPLRADCTSFQMARPHPGKLAPPPLCRR